MSVIYICPHCGSTDTKQKVFHNQMECVGCKRHFAKPGYCNEIDCDNKGTPEPATLGTNQVTGADIPNPKAGRDYCGIHSPSKHEARARKRSEKQNEQYAERRKSLVDWQQARMDALTRVANGTATDADIAALHDAIRTAAIYQPR